MIDREILQTRYTDLRWRHAAAPAGIVALAIAVVAGIAGPGAVVEQMRTTFMLLGIILALSMPVALLALAQNRWSGALALGIVAGLFAVNLASLTLPRIGVFAELEWNWQGKTLDLVWCLALIGLLTPQMRREIGWTWETRPGTLPVAFINIAILVIVGFFALGADAVGDSARGFTLERILFDASYPNLVEEIVFRGFMLALLDRAFGISWTFGGARIGWGVVLTAWLFGLVHGVSLDAEGALVLEPVYFLMTFVAGLVLGWIRALTGSLWPACLAHSAPEAGILLALALG